MSILVATDLSEHSKDAVRWASALAAALETPLHIAHVIDSLGDDELWTALFETPDEIENRVLSHASEKASAFATVTLQGVPTPAERKVLVAVGPPADEIDAFAKEKGSDLVVCGTSGHGRVRNALFGSTAHRLTHASERSTIFVPSGSSLPPVRKVLVALDFSECASAALDFVKTLVDRWDCDVAAIHGIGVSALSPDYEPGANFIPMVDALIEQRSDQLGAQLTERGLEGQVFVSRAAPAEAILETAESIGADLVVMGTHGRGAVGRFILGSVALRVLRETKCPVATIHALSAESAE